ncbi:Calmodulin-binding protein 60 D [Nymphaea thermarum]|nr:Calmodulin-binding protein 60 D [Nymphaea thermarum]
MGGGFCPPLTISGDRRGRATEVLLLSGELAAAVGDRGEVDGHGLIVGECRVNIQKRQQEGEEGCGGRSPEEKRRRVPLSRSYLIANASVAVIIIVTITVAVVTSYVHEEIEKALGNHSANKLRPCAKQIHPSSSRSLQLLFTNRLSLPVFTGSRIEGEDGLSLGVSLMDTFTGQLISSGPESSVKVEIVVLEGDFEGNEENWTHDQFKANIVRERDGRRQLLGGCVFLDLNGGIGTSGDLLFTDNSSWTRSRKFRLGARVDSGHVDGVRIQEAMSEPFVVKDHRGELYKKHYPPSLADEVWRLEKIGKDGAFHKRLNKENIHTVKDFLTLLSIDSQRLRSILGSGMSTKMWDIVVDHAKSCKIGGQMYVYYCNPDRTMGVLFNVVGELLSVLLKGRLVALDELTDTLKAFSLLPADVQKLVKTAYKNWSEVCSYDLIAASGDSLQLSSATLSRSPGPQPPSSDSSTHFSAAGLCSPHPSASLTDVFSSISSSSALGLDECLIPGVGENCGDNSFASLESHVLCTPYSDPASLYRPTDSLVYDAEIEGQSFCSDEHLQYFDSDAGLQLQTSDIDEQEDIGVAVRGFLVGPKHCKAEARWMTLRYVLNWSFSIKRKVASKRSKMRQKQILEFDSVQQ